jgi:ethanolamine ammonia-lyase small subunit
MDPPPGRPKGEFRRAQPERSPTTQDVVTPQPWQSLRRFTAARIALGRAGHSVPTAAHLDLQASHAAARDAVHLPFDADGVAAAVRAQGLATLALHSAAADRATYLQRPDLGRRLDEASRAALAAWRVEAGAAAVHDLAVVVADGLSALAVNRHAAGLLGHLMARLRADAAQPWSVAPVALARQARVALGDEIGEGLRARTVLVLIGERPGLSSPDSLGLYFTWAPRPGRSDAERNCISNVRPEGLPLAAAAARLHRLLGQARSRQLTGVGLKDESDDRPALAEADRSRNFLLAGG